MISRIFKRYNDHWNNVDFHMHTSYTDGKSSMYEMIEECARQEIDAIAITDHARKTSNYFGRYFSEINKLKKEFSLVILKGIETRIADFLGNLDYPENITNDLDIVIASVHRVSINDKFFTISKFDAEIAFEIEKFLCLQAIFNSNDKFHVLGHCGGMCICAFNHFPMSAFEDIIKACTEYDVAFELNSRYHSNFFAFLKPLLEKYNPYVTYGSDAHSIGEIRSIMKWEK